MDRIGPYNILMVEEVGKDRTGHKRGKFLCPYEHEDGLPHYFECNITSVRTGKTRSCGCARERDKRKKKTLEEKVKQDNVLGKTFNRLTVIKPLKVNEHGSVVYLCKCSCSDNSYKETTASNLKCNLVTSCGCIRKETSKAAQKRMAEGNRKDLSGQKCGTWTAIAPLEKREKSSGAISWLCRCENGHYNTITTSNWGKIKTCRFCKNSSVSIGESVVQTILESLGIKYQKEKTFENCLYKRRLRFDFYLPDYNCCIEYDGIQHFQPTNFSHDNFEERTKKDCIKEEYCRENGIKLIRIPYTDLDLIDEEYIKRRLDEEVMGK